MNLIAHYPQRIGSNFGVHLGLALVPHQSVLTLDAVHYATVIDAFLRPCPAPGMMEVENMIGTEFCRSSSSYMKAQNSDVRAKNVFWPC